MGEASGTRAVLCSHAGLRSGGWHKCGSVQEVKNRAPSGSKHKNNCS